ncbi:hypothetical protein N7528_010165 [Penicillium herquei]|nr:hypothetical protein N7528_010165 [Penicillium herquei]
MASEPSEDAIANFVSFTSTTREQAVNFLKVPYPAPNTFAANNLDSQKAINAYFEDPTGPHSASGWQNDDNLTPLGFSQEDIGPRMPATAPPTRPPSRVNLHDTSQGAGTDDSTAANTPGSPSGLAEREEQELQQAVAMSLNQGMSTQESGVTTTAPESQAQFGKATRDHYDEGAWAMTLFNETAQEVVISPDPEDRKKVGDEPAFIRPTQDNLFLGGFLTILHEIPLAREALLLRNKLLFDYGHDAQWWNGQPINLPKIVTVHEGTDDSDWDDPIYETQRLMAFLDSTQRAFGSSDALSNTRPMFTNASDSEEAVARFLEIWFYAAVRADPDNPLCTTFMSHAYKRTPFDPDDEPISKELFVFGPIVEQAHGQTLYDVLDSAIWSDRPGEDLDDVWLEHVGEILVMKLDSHEEAKSVDVKIPAVFYPDRYLSSCQEIARELRMRKLETQQTLMKVQEMIDYFQMPLTPCDGLTNMEIIEKTAECIPVALKTAIGGGSDLMTAEAAREKVGRIPQQLKALALQLGEKLKGKLFPKLEAEKQEALETMRKYSKVLTEPSDSPQEPPTHRYTLRGVCTEPHVTYILKRREDISAQDLMDMDGDKNNDYQWWRTSFSTDDGKTRQAEKHKANGDNTATQNGDVVGYTARKVREIEVLDAARREGRSVLLVYASDDAMGLKVDPAPSQLQAFVQKDNEAFAIECSESTAAAADSDNLIDLTSDISTGQQPMQKSAPVQTEVNANANVNVFDYEVQGFEGEKPEGQEMQEKRGSRLLTSGSGIAIGASKPVPHLLDSNEGWTHAESDEEMADHIEHAPAK